MSLVGRPLGSTLQGMMPMQGHHLRPGNPVEEHGLQSQLVRHATSHAPRSCISVTVQKKRCAYRLLVPVQLNADACQHWDSHEAILWARHCCSGLGYHNQLYRLPGVCKELEMSEPAAERCETTESTRGSKDVVLMRNVRTDNLT